MARLCGEGPRSYPGETCLTWRWERPTDLGKCSPDRAPAEQRPGRPVARRRRGTSEGERRTRGNRRESPTAPAGETRLGIGQESAEATVPTRAAWGRAELRSTGRSREALEGSDEPGRGSSISA